LNENSLPSDLPQATLVPKKRARIPAVWAIPLFAALVAIGIAIHSIMSEGPTIRILFKAAQGIEAGKTFIKYKDVNIGQVTAVELSPGYTQVMVTAKIAKSAEGLMVEDARFWVVQPRITLSGVSGLGTLLSGNYIGFGVGSSKKPRREFTALDVPPVVAVEEPGKEFVLTADDLGSLGIGSPIYFRRLQVGQVTAYNLEPDGKTVQIKAFVKAPFDRFVTEATRFWNASGLDVSVGAGGVDVRTQSLVSVLIGGLAFETPAFASGGDPAAANTVFTLYSDRATAMKQPDAIEQRYVLYFNESLRGLSAGAPVTILGLTAGEVTDVGLDIDPTTAKLRGRVELVAYPERLIGHLHASQAAVGESMARSEQQRHAFLQKLVEERGLRAQLRTGSLLTGQLDIAMEFFPDAPKADVDWSAQTPVVPTVPSTLPDVEAKLTGILAKLDKLPYAASASRGADNAHGQRVTETEGVSDGDHPFADLQFGGIGQGEGRDATHGDLDDCHVRLRVAAAHLGVELAPVGQPDPDLLGALHHVVVGQDIGLVREEPILGSEYEARALTDGAAFSLVWTRVGNALEALAEEPLEEILSEGEFATEGGHRPADLRAVALALDLDEDYGGRD
jgi:paraquat-inducible protein B